MTASIVTSDNDRGPSKCEPLSLERSGLTALAPSPKPEFLNIVTPEGQLHVHTAPFRGTFSTVLSHAVRMAGLGSRVLVVQFLKGGVNQGIDSCIRLCGQLRWLRPNIENCITSTSYPAGVNSVKEIWQKCCTHLKEGDIDQLVLDEIGLAVKYGYISEEDLYIKIINRPSPMDVIITGPEIPDSVLTLADQVTELRRGF